MSVKVQERNAAKNRLSLVNNPTRRNAPLRRRADLKKRRLIAGQCLNKAKAVPILRPLAASMALASFSRINILEYIVFN